MAEDMAVYIANLGKYNEGYLVGDWFTFPLDEEDIAERIGLNAEYEEYAVHDTDNFPIEISEYTSIEELNRIYEQVQELPEEIVENLNDFISHYGSLQSVVDNKDNIIFYPGCDSMEDVARYFAEEYGSLVDIPPQLSYYIDYQAYGRDLEIEGSFRAVVLSGGSPAGHAGCPRLYEK